jgi:thiamine pyrophosphokinase
MRAIIIANGEFTAQDAARAAFRPDDLLIAADGGLRHFRALGQRPHLVIGDLDSITSEERAMLNAEDIPVEQHPAEKDETDLELALLYAARQNAAPIVVLGGFGRRVDMTLANLMLLTHPQLANVRVEFWSGAQTVWLIRPPGAEVRGQPGDTLSLLPLGGDAIGVTTRGLFYPLRDEPLAFGSARGVSNVLTTAPAHVALRAGLLVAVHTLGRA